eukprot:5725893-Pyramimonas_sp.AAC.2
MRNTQPKESQSLVVQRREYMTGTTAADEAPFLRFTCYGLTEIPGKKSKVLLSLQSGGVQGKTSEPTVPKCFSTKVRNTAVARGTRHNVSETTPMPPTKTRRMHSPRNCTRLGESRFSCVGTLGHPSRWVVVCTRKSRPQ